VSARGPGIGIGAAIVAAGILIGLGPTAGWFSVPPAAIAAATLALLVFWPSWRSGWAAWLPVAPALASLAWTAFVLVTGQRGSESDAGIPAAVEVGSLLGLLGLVVRWTEGWAIRTVTPLLAAAQMTWILRFIPDQSALSMVGACALFGLGSAATAVVAAYPRRAADRMRTSLDEARAEQRRQLERDLHDYVAHDLSSIIVQAQAARFAGANEPATLLRSLQRIEAAGLQAMSSMEAVLELLRSKNHSGADRPEQPIRRPSLDDLTTLVGSFRESWHGEVESQLEAHERVAPAESELLYRVASEGLTNIRRHAAPDSPVRVLLITESSARMRLIVENGRGGLPAVGSATSDRGGTGLRRLREQAALLGGTLEAGPTGQGWSVAAAVPLETRGQHR
jgi:signal transduction histidine kinase